MDGRARVTFGGFARHYLPPLRHAPAAIGEGCCPMCGARLAPASIADDFDAAGLCAAHGLWEQRGGDYFRRTYEGVD